MDLSRKTEPLSPHLGVRLTGIALEELADRPDFIREMKRLRDEHLLVHVPLQALSPETMQRFTSRLGPPLDMKRPGSDGRHIPGCDYLKVIANAKDADGVPYGEGNSAAQGWHTDAPVGEVPPGTILFYCRETTSPAPKTHFKNMIKVYEALPEKLKDRINPLRVIHFFSPVRAEFDDIYREGQALTLEDRQRGFAHPLVRRHLGSDRPSLFLPVRRDSLILGLPEQESRDLLTALWDFTDSTDFDASIALEKDDFVLWDNTATVHGRDGWPETESRIMWHTGARSEAPTPFYPRQAVNTVGMSPDKAREIHRREFEAASR